MACKTVLILPSHRPGIQRDENESENLKTLCQQVQWGNIYQRTALEYVEFKAIQ